MKIRILKTNRKCKISPYLAYIPGVYEDHFINNPKSPFYDNAYNWIPTMVDTGTPRQNSAWAEFLNTKPIEDWTKFENRVNHKSWWYRLWRKR